MSTNSTALAFTTAVLFLPSVSPARIQNSSQVATRSGCASIGAQGCKIRKGPQTHLVRHSDPEVVVGEVEGVDFGLLWLIRRRQQSVKAQLSNRNVCAFVSPRICWPRARDSRIWDFSRSRNSSLHEFRCPTSASGPKDAIASQAVEQCEFLWKVKLWLHMLWRCHPRKSAPIGKWGQAALLDFAVQ